MYGPITGLWAAFQENKVLVEVASDKQECSLVSDPRETYSTSTRQKVGEKVFEEVMVAERNRFHDDGTTTSGVGNEKYIHLTRGKYVLLINQIE